MTDRAGTAHQRRPYEHAAELWFAAGWSVIPIPFGEKAIDVAGFTGNNGHDATIDDVHHRIDTRGGDNAAVRMPMGVVGFDFDLYKGTEHRENFANLQRELGVLPATWRITARGDGVSGIRLFRQPSCCKYRDEFDHEVGEVIQRHHRYALVPPSMHPELHVEYRLFDPDDEVTYVPPSPADLPFVPLRWHESMRTRKPTAKQRARVFWDRDYDGAYGSRRSGAVVRAFEAFENELAAGRSRHNTARDYSCALIRLASQGHPGAMGALNELGDIFIAAAMQTVPDRRTRSRREAEIEWHNLVVGGEVRVATTEPERDNYETLTARDFSWVDDMNREAQMIIPTLAPAARYGILAETVAELGPHTEADPVAILAHLLVGFGSEVGRDTPRSSGPYIRIGASKHAPHEFIVPVGDSAKARKGTAHSESEGVMMWASPGYGERVWNGIGSGEGLIGLVNDEPRQVGYDEEAHESITEDRDRRCLIVEEEFARLLTVSERRGSTLSETIRSAWDGKPMKVVTKSEVLHATDHHLSIIGHITNDELRVKLDNVDVANGFANRFLWLAVHRARVLPDGGGLPESSYQELGEAIGARLDVARKIGEMKRSAEANALWRELYHVIDAHDPGGAYGSVMARAEAHLLRLSMIYALTDATDTIEAAHIEAAWAFLCYADETAAMIFGGVDRAAHKLVAALELRAPNPMTRAEVHEVFGRNLSKDRLERLLGDLEGRNIIRSEKCPSGQHGGRPTLFTHLCSDGPKLKTVTTLASLRAARETPDTAHSSKS